MISKREYVAEATKSWCKPSWADGALRLSASTPRTSLGCMEPRDSRLARPARSTVHLGAIFRSLAAYADDVERLGNGKANRTNEWQRRHRRHSIRSRLAGWRR